MSMAREHRVARNHELFRDVNDRIYSLTEEFGAHPAHYLVLAGHELPDLERVIEANSHDVVVERNEVFA